MMATALVPAYNEEATVGRTVGALRQALPEVRIVVVDDGSQDRTAQLAEAAGAHTVVRARHTGKGGALRAGLPQACTPLLLMLDADLGETASEAASLLSPLLSGEADLAIGVLAPSGRRGGGMGLVVKLARWGIGRLTGRRMEAPLSGQRALRREVVEAAGGFANGWGAEVALTVRALRAGYRVVEVPVMMQHRVTGRSAADVLHRARQLFDVARTLAVLAALRSPSGVH